MLDENENDTAPITKTDRWLVWLWIVPIALGIAATITVLYGWQP